MVKDINIKNRSYYFFNEMINVEDLDSNFLKINKISYKNIGVHHIGCITIKEIGDYENIYSANPSYLIVTRVDGHTEEKNGSKYHDEKK